MSHILFLVHGVGKHGTEWAESADGPIDTLKAAARQYAFFRRSGLESRVDLVPIEYDALFTDVVNTWKQNAASVNELDPSGVVRASLGWLDNASEENFFWTHAADAVFYRFSTVYRQLIRTHVINQIAQRLDEEFAEQGSATCSVMAHSLGTAVAHDCLHYLGTTRWGDVANPFHPTHWRFQHVFMIANTSRLLESDDTGMAQAYRSIVRPGPVEDPASYCGTYWNFRHEFDPIAIPKRFDAVGWTGYTLDVVSHYHEANIHGFSHYLTHPKVHVPILRKVVKSTCVTEEEFQRAVNPDNFPQFNVAQIDRAKAHLLKLAGEKLDVGENPSNKSFVRMLVNVYRLVQEFRQ